MERDPPGLRATGGDIRSPVILPVVLKEPSQDSGFFGAPLRVTRIVLPIRLTFASSAKQVALSFEIVTSSATPPKLKAEM